MIAPIRPRERDAILQSLAAGVVPRVGQQHIQVGRSLEIKALLGDLERMADGGCAIRFVIGEYGSGKTFFLQLVRAIAHEKRMVVVQADLAPDRRLHATGGQARSLYAELMRNLSTRSKPEGGALASVVERFVSTALQQAQLEGRSPAVVIQERLSDLTELVGGFDFAQVIAQYWKGHDTGNDVLKADAIRWLRGEFSTKTEARAALGVRTIVDDASVYDHLKLMSRFVRHAGYAGFVVELDELVNVYKLANSQARSGNYEQILRILNDCLQGGASSLGFLFGGTPDFLLDVRRGLYSYEALRSRLMENRFATDGMIDLSGPVIRLTSLTQEDLFVLLQKLRDLHANGDPSRSALPNEGLQAFMAHCSQQIGEVYFRTPRNTIRAFVQLLQVLDQNEAANWQERLGGVSIQPDEEASLSEGDIVDHEVSESATSSTTAKGVTPAEEDDLAAFRL